MQHDEKYKLFSKIYLLLKEVEVDLFSFFDEKKDEILKDKLYKVISQIIIKNFNEISQKLLGQEIRKEGINVLDENALTKHKSKQEDYKSKVSSFFFNYSFREGFNNKEQLLISKVYYTSIFSYFSDIKFEESKSQEKMIVDILSLISAALGEIRQTHIKFMNWSIKVADAISKYLPTEIDLDSDIIQLNWVNSESDYMNNSSRNINLLSYKSNFSKVKTQIDNSYEQPETNEEILLLFLINKQKLVKISLSSRDLELYERLIINLDMSISKANIIKNNFVQIYLSGFPEPESIMFDTYENAMNYPAASGRGITAC